jgi:hypothetical protein
MTAPTLVSGQFPRQRPSAKVTLAPGTMVYLLTPHGEGSLTAWANGALISMDITNLKQPDIPGAGYSGCVETQTCNGEVLAYPKCTWWVKLRNATGQIGWTSQTADFHGRNALDR